MDDLMREALQAAAEGGEPVTICYNAGSRPGQARPLVILQVKKDRLAATEPGKRRQEYKLDMIAWAEFSDGRRFDNPDAGPAITPKPPLEPLVLSAEAEEIRARLQEAITKGETLHIEMGTAMDWDMNPVPWRGFIAPTGFRRAGNELRVVCETEPDGSYGAFDEHQTGGRKHLAVGSFRILGVSDHKIDPDGGLEIGFDWP